LTDDVEPMPTPSPFQPEDESKLRELTFAKSVAPPRNMRRLFATLDAVRLRAERGAAVIRAQDEMLKQSAVREERLREALKVMWMFYAGKARTDLPAADFNEVRDALTPSLEALAAFP